MLAARATRFSAEDPLSALDIVEVPEPIAPEGWTTITVRAASLNHHDLWTLRGVGIREDRLPITLGCDASGVDEDGNEVVVHGVIGDPDNGDGDETLDPGRSLLSEVHDGTFATRVVVPRRNVVRKPASLTFEEAACLPVAWLTAYRMLTTKARLQPGSTVLVQGAGGGVSTAAIILGRTMGLRVWCTSRDALKRERAVALGAHQSFAPGERLPERVDAVIETVGHATWEHSLKSLRPGGCIVVCGATSGSNPGADLSRMFFLQLRVLGSTMGTVSELRALLRLLDTTGVRPVIDRTVPLARAHEAFAAMASGEVFGKIVLTDL